MRSNLAVTIWRWGVPWPKRDHFVQRSFVDADGKIAIIVEVRQGH